MHPPDTITLNWHLRNVSKTPDALRHIIVDFARAARSIRHAIQSSQGGLSGGTNQFGEKQLKLDVYADHLIEQYLRESGHVCCIASEERDTIIELDPGKPYSVVFDPLDGSSLVDVNLAIGSIFGIYAGSEILGKTPRSQVAAGYVLYGPRTILVYSSGSGVHEFLLNDIGEFVLLRENLGVGDTAKTFSPGNLSAVQKNLGYRKALDRWINDGLSLRYSGCMVADVHHVLSKGQGVFSNVADPTGKYPLGKLRLLFECGPFAYLMEQAGGSALDGHSPVLDAVISSVDQRIPLVIGSTHEVETVCAFLR